jgi:predicted enzyme related to lactoylglutathione lyase
MDLRRLAGESGPVDDSRSAELDLQGGCMLLGLRTAIYPAPDLTRAKQWYAQALGQEPYFDQPYYVGFAVGGFELGLVPDGAPGVDGARPLWGVVDVDAAHARLIALGATALEPVTDVGEGIRVAAVRDPFGNRLGLIQNPNFDVSAVR